MSEHEAIKLMLNEIVCINTADHNECERDCANCSLVKETDELLEAYNIAIKALEKQIPKKVIYKPKDAVYQRPFCPCCDKELFDANYSINRCECGQLLMYCG